jgi:hypothetical protein
MTVTEIFAGVEQCDVASMTIGGRTFRCFVWAAGFTLAGAQRIEAGIYVDGEDGQLELIDKAIVASAADDFVDCPRVLAVQASNLFVIHWIDGEFGDPGVVIAAALFRSLFNVTDIAGGWSNQGDVPLYETLQYDHATITGATGNEFVVARRTLVGTIATTRYDAPFSWLDADWVDTRAGLTIANSVLACHANATDNVVLVSYQDTLLLRTYRISATAAAGHATAETYADLLDGDMHFTAVSHERVATNEYLVVCEASPEDEVFAGRDHARLVGWKRISGTTAAAAAGHTSQWLLGWHLLSRAWSWASGVTGFVDAFALLGWHSIEDGQENDQSIGVAVKLETLSGDDYPPGSIRPIPVCALMAGSLDTRPHGQSPFDGSLPSIGTRVNHLSHASGPPQYTLGPDRKTVLVATLRWQRLIKGNEADELQPANAAVGYYRHYHEDEWTVRRDEKEVAQPDTPAWRGANSRPMALPVEVSTGLVLAGGVTTAYDGQQPVELGFFHAPEITVDAVAMGGTMDDAETYHWFCNYAWADSRGALHRGPPSRPVSVAVVANGFARITCRCHNLGEKDNVARHPLAASRPIVIETWRTTAPGGAFETTGPNSAPLYIFRREYGADAPFAIQNTPTSDPDAFTVTFDVGRPNSEVGTNEIAPWQLDLTTLQWTPPPPITHQPLAVAAVWQNRLFGVDPELGLLRWSEEILPIGASPLWPEFLDTNTFRLDGVGDVTAMQVMDETLIVFSRDGVYALTGDPGAGGANISLRLQRIASGIGCTEPRSVVHYSEGIFFQSAKGIHRVTRGLGIDYPGAAIEDLIRAAGNVRGAVHLENRHQIRYSLQAAPGTGPLVVRPRVATYDYRVGKWSTRTFPMLAQSSTASRLNEHQHATAWRGLQGETLHVVLQQGGLAIERAASDTVYADVNSSSANETVCLDVITEWFHPAGIVGQWLCDEIGIQTERVNAGPLTIQAWYNVDGLFDGTYDLSTPRCTWTYDGVANFAPAYIPFRLNALKVSWVKLRIFEPSTAPATENVRLVSLTLNWRHLAGPRRVAR